MTSSHRPALGRGLSALIPRTASGAAGLETVDIDLITPNPHQPRLKFDQESLNELADSIREHGVLQPLIVTSIVSDLGPTTYQLIAGERRLQAARMAGLARMPVVIREAAGKDLLELALVENLQREDLNPLEEAQAFVRLSDDFRMTQDQIATRVGRGRAAVANTMRLLTLEDDIRVSLASNQISEGHARALLQIDDARLRLDAWRKIVADNLTVRQAEDIARALKDVQSSAPAKKPKPVKRRQDPIFRAIEDDLRHAIGAPVALKKSGAGGSIVIRFHNDADLERIIQRVTQG
jgi:ParB family transcriptional regulator, chromosome partitioning protein